MEDMAALGLGIRELSKSFEEVLLHFAVDGAATCELVVDYIKCLVQPLGNVNVLDSSGCLMHSSNRVCCDHAMRSKLNLKGTFSMTKLMYIGSYFDSFTKAVIEVALEDMQWEPIGGPHLGAGEEHERLLNLLVPDHENNPHPEKRKKMTTALQVLNGRWDRTTVGHNCVQGPVTGQRCCEDEVAAREKVNGGRVAPSSVVQARSAVCHALAHCGRVHRLVGIGLRAPLHLPPCLFAGVPIRASACPRRRPARRPRRRRRER